ncbi:hypothetical protein D3C86_2114320 [compost metagenome]
MKLQAFNDVGAGLDVHQPIVQYRPDEILVREAREALDILAGEQITEAGHRCLVITGLHGRAVILVE